MDLHSLKIERKPTAPRKHASGGALRWFLLLGLAAAVWVTWPMLSSFLDRMRLPTVKVLQVTEAAPAAAASARGTAANGYVIAARRAALSSDVPGRIVEMLVREGSVVKQGDVVARLFADEYAAALRRAAAENAASQANVVRARAAVQAAQATVAEADVAITSAIAQADEAKAQLQWATSERARTTQLLAQGAGNERDVQRTEADFTAADAKARIAQKAIRATELGSASAKERLAVANADLQLADAQAVAAAASQQLAQATLDKTNVRAPFDGVVVLKDAEVGEVVSPNVQGGSTARGAVCTMVDFASLEIQANVPEATLGSVQVGAPAEVFLDAYPDERLDGQVDRIWPTADRQKATVEVRIKLAKLTQNLRPELGVRIVFKKTDAAAPEAASTQRHILIPESAVVAFAQTRGVFLLERDVATFQALQLGEARNGRVIVDGGLQAGQRIVLDPPISLQSGDRVQFAAQ